MSVFSALYMLFIRKEQKLLVSHKKSIDAPSKENKMEGISDLKWENRIIENLRNK
jgi:hypothetical protein